MNVRYRFIFTAFIFFLTACAAMAQPFHIDGATVRGKGGKSVRFFRPSSPDEDWWYSDEVECIHDVGCVDIVFCMDTSGSMSGTISSLQDDIDRFAYNIASVGFDPRFGLVTYSETINFPHGSTLQDLATFSSTLGDARTGDGGFEHHSDAIYQAIDNFDWRPGCEHVVVLISDECDDASTVSPSATISQILSWGGTVYMLTGDCGDVDDFRDYCDTSYGRWFDYGSSDLNDVFDQIVDDISDVVEIDVTVTNTSGGVLDPVVAELVPDFCITVGDSPNPQSFGPIPASGSHTYLWDIEEIPGCSGWGDCFLIRVTSGSYVDSIVGCLFVEDCGCPGPEAEIVCPEYSGRWTACEDQQIDIEYTGYLGVDPNTLCITVNGTVYCYPASPNLTWIPGTRGGTLRFVPSAPGWSHLQHVDIACSAGEDATGCPQLFFPESDFDVDLEPPHPVWWEHHDATWIPPHAAWREPHDDAVSWYPPCGSTLDDTAHIIISALLYDDGVGMTPLDRMIAHLDPSELASMDFVSLWTSLTSIQVTVNDVPFIPGLPIPGSFNRNIDLDLTTYLLDPNSWFGGWAVACTIRADSAGILGLAFLSHEIEVCLKANDLVEADGCMPCENDTEWCCTYYLAGDVPLTADAGPDRYICLGTNTTIGGTPPAGGGVEPYSYSWSPGTGLSSTTIGNPTASPTTTTTYTLTVTDHDGSVATDDMTVFVSNPSADAGRDSTICPGASVPLGGDPTGSGGFGSLTYSWTPTGGLSDPSAANPWFSSDFSWGDTTITFTVTVTDTLGCEATDDIVITVSPIIPDAGPDKMICIGESVTLGGSPTASGGVGPYAYSWYEYPGGTAFSTDANPVVSPIDTTLYVVHISGGDPYCSAVDSCTVYPVQPLADAGADTVVCSGGSVVIGGAPTGSGSVPPYLYEWSSEPAGFISSDANPLVTPFVSTNYIVTVTDSAGCVDVDTVVVDVAPGPSAAYTVPLPCDGITSCENQWINVRIGEGSGGGSRRILWLSDLSYASGRLSDSTAIGYSHAAESLATWGWDVEEYPQDSVLTAVMLYDYSVVVIGNVKADGPRMYTAAERTALEDFVANGGHILSMSGWVIPNDDIDLENFLLSGFGLSYMSHDSWWDSLPPVFGSPIDPGVDWVAGYGVKWVIGLDECWAHSGSDCACGVKHFGAGDVVMFFDEHWLFNGPWHDINFTTHQNARLFKNIMSYFVPFDSVSCPIDPASIVLNVDGINYTTADPELSWIDPNLSFNPSVPWAHGDTIIFELINASDSCGCSINLPPCSFVVDIEPPMPDPLVPPDGSVLFASPDSVGVFIADAPAGVDPASFDYITIEINGLPATGWTYSWDGGYLSLNGLGIDSGDSVVICFDSLFDAPTYDYCAPNDTSFCWWFLVLPCDLEITAHPDTALCGGGTIALSVDVVGGSGFLTYSWTPVIGLDDATIPNPTAIVDSTVNYVVTVYDESLACSETDTATIVVSDPAAHAGPDGAICPFGTIALGEIPAATGGFAPYSYEWLDLAGTPLYAEPNPSHSFADTSETFILHIIDSLGCEAFDTVAISIDYESPTGIDLISPASEETVALGGAYFEWSPEPISADMLYNFFLDGTLLFERIDSTHVTVDFPCGESHTWAVAGISECLEAYVVSGDTTFTEWSDTVYSIADSFYTPECTEPFAVAVRVPDGDWTACDPDSIVAFIIDSAGIVESSISMTVNGLRYRTTDSELSWDGDSTLIFRPSVMWADGETVSVCVDSAVNIDDVPLISPVCWEFYIDRSAPEIVSVSPAPGSEIPPTTDAITICVRDDLSGLDSIYVNIDGTPFAFGPFGCVDTTVCFDIPLTPPLPSGDTVDVDVVRATDCPDWCGPNVGDSAWVYIVSSCDLTVNAYPDTGICSPDSLHFEAIVSGGSGAYHCHWYPDSMFADPLVCNPTGWVGSTGWVRVVVTDDSMWCFAEDSVFLILSELAIDAGSDGHICPGATIALGCDPVAFGGIEPYSYSWQYLDGTEFSSLPNPDYAFADSSVTLVLEVMDSIGCVGYDTIAFVIDYEPIMAINLISPTGVPVPPGDVYFEWEPIPGGVDAVYDFYIDGITLFSSIDSTHVSVPFPCGETHGWGVRGYTSCEEVYTTCAGDTVFTSVYDTALSANPAFHTSPCGVPSATYFHVPSGDWTACDPDSIVWLISDSVGIVESSIEVRINGATFTTADGELTWDGISRLRFVPSPMWPSGTTVDACLISVMNLDSIWLPDSVCGEFYVDLDPPVVWGIDPAPGATVVAAGWSTFDFFIFDSLSGLDESSVGIRIDGTLFDFTDPAVSWDGDSTVSIDISGLGIGCGDTVFVELFADDSPDWCGPNAIDDTFRIFTAPCGLTPSIIEPLPNTISACEDQGIAMRITGSGSSCACGRRILWVYNPGSGSWITNDIFDHGVTGWFDLADTLAHLGFVNTQMAQSDFTLTPAFLANYDVLVLGGLVDRSFSPSEAAAVESFVAGCGSVIAITTGGDESLALNSLMGTFGMNYLPGTYEGGCPTDFSPHFITEGLTEICAEGCLHMSLGPTATCIIRDDMGDCAFAVCEYGLGRAMMFFDEQSFWNGPTSGIYTDITEVDNCLFDINVFNWAVHSEETSCPVDPSSIVLNVDGVDYTVADGELAWVDPILTWTPPVDWAHGSEVDVCLTAAEDSCGGSSDLLPLCWTFEIDLQPPIPTTWTPPCGSSIDADSGADFHIVLEDGPALIESVEVSIDGVDYDLGSALTISGSTAEFTWNPVLDGGLTLSPGDVFSFCIHTGDSGIAYCDPHDTVICCDYVVPTDTGVVTANIVEPLPNTISACDDQRIAMTIHGSSVPFFGGRILWLSDYDYSDDCRLISYDARGYAAIAASLVVWGYSEVVEVPETTSLTPSLLADYSLLVFGGLIERDFSTVECAAIEGFVADGGCFLEIAGGLPVMHFDGIRDVIAPFGINILDPLLPDECCYDMAVHPVTDGVGTVCTEGAFELVTTSPAISVMFDDAGRALCSVREYGLGKVAVFGDEQFLWNGPTGLPYTYLGHVDNGVFARNLFRWLMTETTEITCPVDPSSIVLRVNGVDYSVADGELSWSPDSLIFTPSVLWNHGDSVHVCLTEAEDSCGAALASPVCWDFYIDLQPPLLSELDPPCGTPLIPGMTDDWSITLTDDVAGLMPDSTAIVLDGVVCPISGPDTIRERSFSFDWNPSDCGITLVPGDTITLCIETSDGPVDYCEPNDTIYCCDYPVVDTGGPVATVIRVPADSISACDPESIIVELLSAYPIVESTIVLSVDGTSYGTSDYQVNWLDPYLTYNPDPDWNDHDTVFASLVSAEDIFGNPCINAPLSWVFYIDRVEPTSEMLEPTAGYTRDLRQQIIIDVEDLLAGVDPSTLILEIDGLEYRSGDFDWIPDGLGGRIRWIPDEHGVVFNAGDTVNIRLTAGDAPDLCGPNIHIADYVFYVEPWTPCLVVPNPFTPTGDGVNDITIFDWPNMTTEGATIYIFTIRNVLVRKYDLPAQYDYDDVVGRAWDGRDENNLSMPQGLYLYVVESGGRVVCNGTITLIR